MAADIIPQQTGGNETDNKASISFTSQDLAKEHYELARVRLLDINHWGNISGFVSASFQLRDEKGQQVKNRLPKPGDYLRIKIPAPAPFNDYDWVKIEMIDELNNYDHQMTAIQVRPAPDPTKPAPETDHFFTSEATSSFVVARYGNSVIAEVHGRNEKPNISESESLVEGLRNATIAAGAMLGLAEFQWNNLVKGLVKLRT